MKSAWFVALSVTLVAAGCSTEDDSSRSDETVVVAAAPPVPTTTPRVASLPVPPASAPVSGPVTSTTEAPEDRPYAVPWPVPVGEIEVGPDDIVALRTDGQLVLLRGALSGSVDDEPIAEVGTIDIGEVAGIVNGALVFGSCCGSSSGLFSVSEAGGRLHRFFAGRHPAYSPTRNWLVAIAASRTDLAIHDVPSGLVTTAPYTDDEVKEPLGVVWAADDSAVFVLTGDESATLTRIHAAPPFEQEATVDLARLFPGADPSSLRLAGLGPSGEVAIWAVEGDRAVIRFVDPLTLVEQPNRERDLAATATAIRLGPDGGLLLWVDGETLWYQPLFSEAGILGDGYRAAWFLG